MRQNIIILGAGESGVGAALLAQAKGYEVFVSDQSVIAPQYKALLEQHNIRYEEGQHTAALILEATEVIKSPGIPEDAPIIQKLRNKEIPIVAELEFASRFTKARFIGITGTNGKTTTALLTYHLLKEAGLKVGLAGNIGSSLAKQVIRDEFDYYVLEISSFQLDDMYSFKPWIAVLLNITPDHLDRYGNSMERYVKSKFRITQQLDNESHYIYFADDEWVAAYSKPVVEKANGLPISITTKTKEGAYKEGDNLFFTLNKKGVTNVRDLTLALSQSPLRGIHNAINTMAAVLVALVAGVETAKIEIALKSFKNAPNRLEMVGTINEVAFVNDSKATNVDAVYYALEGFKEPLVWIAGGIDKGNDYAQIASLVKEHVKALVCLGKDNKKLMDFFKDIIPLQEENESMEGAVSKAFEVASQGDVVLLSPACASFDLFENYEDRGDKFRAAVKALGEEVNASTAIDKKLNA